MVHGLVPCTWYVLFASIRDCRQISLWFITYGVLMILEGTEVNRFA